MGTLIATALQGWTYLGSKAGFTCIRGSRDNRAAFSGCCLNHQTGDYCTQAAHLQDETPQEHNTKLSCFCN